MDTTPAGNPKKIMNKHIHKNPNRDGIMRIWNHYIFLQNLQLVSQIWLLNSADY